MMRLAFAVLPLPVAGRMHRLWLQLLATLMLLGAAQAFAQTVVSGPVVGNTRWTAASSPYLVSGNIVVQGGAVLTIDAGVTVYMAPQTSLTVQSGGLRVTGTSELPVRVLSDRSRQGQGAPGDWGQWVFQPGAVDTRLDHVLFEHGKGLVVNGASPVFNHLDIRNQQGVAIAIDLAASPAGVGNRASGNGLNGVAVPSGDVAGTVRWGLRGIPYVVSAGTVSVGASPAITGVTPNTVEQGQTVTLTVSGTRLGGLARPSFDQPGLALTPFSGGSASQAFMQLVVDPAAPIGPATLRLQVDAGELVFPNAVTVTQPLPAITAIDPSTVLAGTGSTQVTVTGRNFGPSSEVLFNAASVPTQVVSTTVLRATLPNQTATGTLQTQVRSPDPLHAGQHLLSNSVPLSVQAPVPPTVAIEPSPIALPPDSKAREVTIRLSKPDYRDNTLSFSISDTSKATVSPASVVVPAGQTVAKVTLVPLATGTVSLVVDSPTLQRVSVPLFITADFRGANTSYAPPVGVVVERLPGTVTRQVTLADSTVGVAVGAVLKSAAPSAWIVGDEPTLTIHGAGIPANAQVALVPSAGVTVGTVTVAPDGTQLQVTLATAANAAVGPRKLIVRDGAGRDIVFADASRARVQLMTGLPAIDSIEPIVAARGSMVTVLVRGRHLQQGALRVLPDSGLRIDSMPVASADGTTLTARIDVAADAGVGARVVQIVTPAGTSPATVTASNTLSIVSAIRHNVPTASALVGVMVGSAPPSETLQVQQAAASVGVLTGAGITGVAPRVGVIGTDVLVTVRGTGLDGVSSVALVPAAGVSFVGSPAINGNGTELQFTLRVEPSAALGARRLVFTAAGKPLTPVRPADLSFLVSAPIPELTAVAPQILVTGQAPVKMTVRGRNFTNVSGVRIEPSQGTTIAGPFEVSGDGTMLSFDASVASGSASGERTVIVTTAAGESTATPGAGNLVRVATQLGPTYANLMSPTVGVTVGATTLPPANFDGTLASTAVGVVVGSAPAPDTVASIAASPPVGVVVGTAAQTMSPTGWLQGASGTITLTGRELGAVTSAVALPSTGVLLGAPVASDGGTVLTLSVSVAPDAPQVVRELRLGAAGNGRVSFATPDVGRFGIGSLPVMSSVSPIVFEQGKGVTLRVRGSNLKGVTRVAFSPDSGIRATSGIAWSQDDLGELLTVSVTVDAGAPLGERAVVLQVHGGATSATPSPTNKIDVVTPQ